MSKYDSLWEFIKINAPSVLSFDEVRRICGFPIDHSFLNCKKELETYGYRVAKISMKNQTVEFHQQANIKGGGIVKYFQTITLADGKTCVIRNGTERDAEAVLSNFILTHAQTDFLTTYPEETTFTVDQEKEYLKKKADSDREIELVAEVDGKIVGTAGVDLIRAAEKIRHRASFGISIEQAFWGLGIGWALTSACIECAKTAGYSQIELEVVADNRRAFALYQRAGYVEYGRNPRGFRSRKSGWQETVLMRRELDG